MKNIAIILSALLFAGCVSSSPKLLPADAYEGNVGGKEVHLYTLHAGNTFMQVSNFGGHVVSLFTQDRGGKWADIVLGRPSIEEYVNAPGERFLGSTVGLYGNRIANGRFTLDGVEYTLPQNNGENCLHGGLTGIDMDVWDVVSVNDSVIVFHYLKPDMQDGFPGNVDINITFALTSQNEFKVSYEATTDKATVVNLTHHSFFNLKGEGEGDCLGHEMQIFADGIVPVGANLIPTGEIMPVEGTPFDFREPHTVGERVGEENEQLANGNGYDHCWVLSKACDDVAAVVYEPTTGRQMTVSTDQPGVQFYCGNFLDGKQCGKNGKPFEFRGCVVLETQKFPDSPNQPQFPSTVLRPGETYTHWCTYKFDVR